MCSRVCFVLRSDERCGVFRTDCGAEVLTQANFMGKNGINTGADA